MRYKCTFVIRKYPLIGEYFMLDYECLSSFVYPIK